MFAETGAHSVNARLDILLQAEDRVFWAFDLVRVCSSLFDWVRIGADLGMPVCPSARLSCSSGMDIVVAFVDRREREQSPQRSYQTIRSVL